MVLEISATLTVEDGSGLHWLMPESICKLAIMYFADGDGRKRD